jgi:predicted  nucleic acid-binding Zn-ribbon protein
MPLSLFNQKQNSPLEAGGYLLKMELQESKPKSFWNRPEGTTGMLFAAGVLLGGGYLLYQALPFLIKLASNTLYLAGLLIVLAAVIYMILDPKMRNLIFYIYKSIMRWVTGLFVQIDPIGILKTYIEELQGNLGKMNQQISKLKGQMINLKTIIDNNKKQIQNDLSLASKAKETDRQAMMVLKARKAGRLQESNLKLDDLYKKMEILYRVLGKMYENSEIMLEDIKDQVVVKEQERKAIRASHSAMRSAMNILNGDKDQRQMFDMAMDSITDDVSQKVGEMQRFMEVSSNFMDSIDLQNGVFEEEGLNMLEKWEKEGISLLLGEDKKALIAGGSVSLSKSSGNQYDKLFE